MVRRTSKVDSGELNELNVNKKPRCGSITSPTSCPYQLTESLTANPQLNLNQSNMAAVQELKKPEKPRWKSPDLPSQCTYKLGDPLSASPHIHVKREPMPKILPNVLSYIGETPLIKMNRITKPLNLQCDVLAKCEFFNAGGSIKDRVGKRMIEDAEKTGRLKPGDVLIEPTSGNTGISLAIAAAVKGYRIIIVIPQRMSNEKVDVLKALGAEIVRTPCVPSYLSPESHIGTARRLLSEIPNSVVLDQYTNASNPLAHYDGTAEEILEQCDGQIDMFVAGTGTGGTMTGIARKIKERCPNCITIGVDPIGSKMAEPPERNSSSAKFIIEGIGKDFIPIVCERKYIDDWWKCADKESFLMARQLIKEEGLLCGGSSGSAMYCALEACKKYNLGPNKRCVVILPDSVRNYMTRFLSDEWMIERNFMEIEKPINTNPLHDWWWNLPVKSLKLKSPRSIHPDVTIQETIGLINQQGFEQFPVVDESGSVQGMATSKYIMDQIMKNKANSTDSISKVLFKQFKQATVETTLGELSKMLETEQYVLVLRAKKESMCTNKDLKNVVYGIATSIDLLNFVVSKDCKKTNDSFDNAHHSHMNGIDASSGNVYPFENGIEASCDAEHPYENGIDASAADIHESVGNMCPYQNGIIKSTKDMRLYQTGIEGLSENVGPYQNGI